ncbi:MAG: hypothetical protein IPN20_24775 [Haliscomenobacter sp.]|nr:hypothetical protein [Haliscomenobacter sp.]
MKGKLVGFFPTGNSVPIVVESEGKKYVIKLRAGMSGRFSLLSEWMGNQVGARLGLGCQQPEWMVISSALYAKGIHQEVEDLIVKSYGYNLAFPYQEDMVPLSPEERSCLSAGFLRRVFLFDLALLNVDRSSSNANLVQMDGNVVPLDFEASMLLPSLVTNPDLHTHPQVLRQLRANPLYSYIENEHLAAFLSDLNCISWKEVFEPVPDEAMQGLKKEDLCQLLADRNANGWNIRNMLPALEQIALETEAERNARVEANRKRFNGIRGGHNLTGPDT